MLSDASSALRHSLMPPPRIWNRNPSVAQVVDVIPGESLVVAKPSTGGAARRPQVSVPPGLAAGSGSEVCSDRFLGPGAKHAEGKPKTPWQRERARRRRL